MLNTLCTQRVFAKEKEHGERRVLAVIQRGTKVRDMTLLILNTFSGAQ